MIANLGIRLRIRHRQRQQRRNYKKTGKEPGQNILKVTEQNQMHRKIK